MENRRTEKQHPVRRKSHQKSPYRIINLQFFAMKNIFFLFSLILIMSCGGPRVLHRELAPGAEISTYKTFDFFQTSASGDTMPGHYNDRFDRIKKAIVNELTAKGLTQSTSNPELLVNIGMVIDEEIQTRETNFNTDAPRYIGQRNYSWKSEEIEVGRYRLGTVTVHLVDAKKEELVWEGAIEGVIPDKESRREKLINEGIRDLFSAWSL